MYLSKISYLIVGVLLLTDHGRIVTEEDKVVLLFFTSGYPSANASKMATSLIFSHSLPSLFIAYIESPPILASKMLLDGANLHKKLWYFLFIFVPWYCYTFRSLLILLNTIKEDLNTIKQKYQHENSG